MISPKFLLLVLFCILVASTKAFVVQTPCYIQHSLAQRTQGKFSTKVHAGKQTNDEFWEAQRRMAGSMSDDVAEKEKEEKR